MGSSSSPLEIFRAFVSPEGLSLYEVVQLIMNTRYEGQLRLAQEQRIDFREGMIVGALCPPHTGQKALTRIWIQETSGVASFIRTPEVQDHWLRYGEIDLLNLQESADAFHALRETLPMEDPIELANGTVDASSLGAIPAAVVQYIRNKEGNPSILDMLDRLPFPDSDILKACRDLIDAGMLRTAAGSLPIPGDLIRKNLLFLSNRVGVIYAFYHHMGLFGKFRRRGPHLYYGVLKYPPYRFHVYVLHTTPDLPIRQYRLLFTMADLLMTLGHEVPRTRTSVHMPKIRALVFRRDRWLADGQEEIASLPEFFTHLLEETSRTSGS